MIGAYIALGFAFGASLTSLGFCLWCGVLLRRADRALALHQDELEAHLLILDERTNALKRPVVRQCYDPRAPK